MDRPERPRRCADGDRLDPTAGEIGDIDQGPGGAEQATMARVAAGEAEPAVVGIGRRRLALGVVAAADGAWTDATGRVVGDSLGQPAAVLDWTGVGVGKGGAERADYGGGR